MPAIMWVTIEKVAATAKVPWAVAAVSMEYRIDTTMKASGKATAESISGCPVASRPSLRQARMAGMGVRSHGPK